MVSRASVGEPVAKRGACGSPPPAGPPTPRPERARWRPRAPSPPPTTRCTSPMACASAASTRRPVRKMSVARAGPTARGRVAREREPGVDAEADEVGLEPAALTDDAQVAGQRQSEPRTDGRALHGGHERHGRCEDPHRLAIEGRRGGLEVPGAPWDRGRRRSGSWRRRRRNGPRSTPPRRGRRPRARRRRRRARAEPASVSRLWGGRCRVTTATPPPWCSTETSARVPGSGRGRSASGISVSLSGDGCARRRR